jgi:hypothetical protein
MVIQRSPPRISRIGTIRYRVSVPRELRKCAGFAKDSEFREASFHGISLTSVNSAKVLPGEHCFYTGDGTAVWFRVLPDGTITYADSMKGILSGAGTQTLTYL